MSELAIESENENVAAPPAPRIVRAGSVHIAALDGIRGLAILMVMALHFIDVNAVPHANILWRAFTHVVGFGEAGVDLFFVLSGFLITGILLDAKQTPHYFRNFYARRVLRIFPLYYGALIAVLLVEQSHKAYLPQLPGGTTQIWYWLYTSNFTDMSRGRYIGHFWSLAIEEQFYLVWPAVVWLVRDRWLKWICAGAFVGAFFARLYLARHLGHDVAYYFTPGRVDGLATGAWIALMTRRSQDLAVLRRWTLPFAVCIVLATGLSWLTVSKGDQGWGIIIKHSLQALLFGSIVSLGGAVRAPGFLVHALSVRWLRLLGKYSYGMYVYHGMLVGVIDRVWGKWFEASFHSQPMNQLGRATMAIGITFTIAFLSWHLYEKQFLKLKRHFEYRPAAL